MLIWEAEMLEENSKGLARSLCFGKYGVKSIWLCATATFSACLIEIDETWTRFQV